MYSVDLRLLAFRALQTGKGIRETARNVDVSPSTICRWKKYSLWNQAMRKSRRVCTRLDSDEVQRLIATHPTETLKGLKHKLGSTTSLSTLHRFILKIGYSRKRLSSRLLGKSNKGLVEKFKVSYDLLRSTHDIIASVDECHFSDRLFPQYGYSKTGNRCVLRNPKGGGWKSFSLLLSISSSGHLFMLIYDGSVTRARFQEWLHAAKFARGTVILLDNCSIHHKNDEVFSKLGVQPLYLPPYSPEFQPVELAFSKIKHIFRSLWPHPMGVEEAIRMSVSQITPSDIMGFFRHADRKRCSA
jgi:transposase